MPHRRNLRSTGLRRKGVRSCCDNTCFSKEHHGRKAPGMGQPSHMQTRQALQPDKRFPAQTLIWTRPNFYSDSIMGVYEQARDIVQMILPGVKSRSREVATLHIHSIIIVLGTEVSTNHKCHSTFHSLHTCPDKYETISHRTFQHSPPSNIYIYIYHSEAKTRWNNNRSTDHAAAILCASRAWRADRFGRGGCSELHELDEGARRRGEHTTGRQNETYTALHSMFSSSWYRVSVRSWGFMHCREALLWNSRHLGCTRSAGSRVLVR